MNESSKYLPYQYFVVKQIESYLEIKKNSNYKTHKKVQPNIKMVNKNHSEST